MQGTHPWRELCAAHFGEPTEVTEVAAELAGGWKQLFAARARIAASSAPWERPSTYEVEAAGGRNLPGRQDPAQLVPPTSTLALLRGGGPCRQDGRAVS